MRSILLATMLFAAGCGGGTKPDAGCTGATGCAECEWQ
jgi:hypothetical protein